MVENIKVSVVLTSYNHGKHLRQAIDSVLTQTFSNFELIIIDDGSTDESWEIINSYSDPRVRAFLNKDYKPGTEFFKRIFLNVTSGEYIAIHHSDDLWERDKLEKQVSFLTSHPEIGAVFTWVKVIDENGNSFEDTAHPYYKIFEQPNRTRSEWLHHFFYRGNALCHPSVLIRRVCYETCGAYRFGFAQLGDFDMWVRLCLRYEIYILPERLTSFRVRSGETNASGNRPSTAIRMQFELFQILHSYLQIPFFRIF
jgi:glycosyltransferase involved in cell wall biosynthesis